MNCEELHEVEIDEMARWLTEKVYKFDGIRLIGSNWSVRFVWATGPADVRTYELIVHEARSLTVALCNAAEWVMNARRAENVHGSKVSPHPSAERLRKKIERRVARAARGGA